MTRADPTLLRALKDESNQLKLENQDLQRDLDHLWALINRIIDWSWDGSRPMSEENLAVRSRELLELALFAVRSENGSLLLLDEHEEVLVFVSVIGESQDVLLDYRIPADAGIAGWTAVNRKPALVRDVRTDERWLPSVDQSIGFLTKCLMAVPIIVGEKVIGVLEVVNSITEDPFEKDELELLCLVGKLYSFLYAGRSARM